DDPFPEDPDEANAADHEYQDWIERNGQPDGSLPLTAELHEQVEAAFFATVASSIDALADNLTDREPPKVGTPLVGAETPELYSASDRVRDLSERIVAIDRAERVLSAVKMKLFAQIPHSFVPAEHVSPTGFTDSA